MDTVGKNTSRIAEYIRNQLKENQMGEQLTISEVGPFKERQVAISTQLAEHITRLTCLRGIIEGYARM